MTMFPTNTYNQNYYRQQPLQDTSPLVNAPGFPNLGQQTSTIQAAIERVARHWLQSNLCAGSSGPQPMLNPLRTYLYNQMSNNNYNNQDWGSFVSSVGQAVELALAGNQNLENAISTMVQEVGRFFIVRAVQRDPALQMMLNQNQRQELAMIEQQGNVLAQRISQFQQQRALQNPNLAVQQQQQVYQQGSWGQGMAPGQFAYGMQPQQPTNFQFGALSPQTVVGAGQQGAFYQQPVVGNKDIRVSGSGSIQSSGATQPMVASQQQMNRPVAAGNQQQQQIQQTNDEWMSVKFSPTGEVNVVGANESQTQTFQFDQHPQPNIDYQYNTQQGVVPAGQQPTPPVEVIQPAVQQVQEISAVQQPMSEQPAPQPYIDQQAQESSIGKEVANVSDFLHTPLICYATHRQVGDKIVELSMDYRKIETNYNLLPPEERGKHIPLYREVVTDDEYELEPSGVVDFTNPIIINELLTNVGSDQAINSLKYLKDIYVKGAVLEFTNLNPIPVLLVDREVIATKCSGLFVGTQETDVSQLKKLLGVALSHSRILFEELNYRGTEAINKILTVSMGLNGMRIDSFYDDWDDLVRILAGRGKQVIDAFTDQLGYIVHAVACLAPKEMEEFLLDVTFDQMCGTELSGIHLDDNSEVVFDTPQVIGNRRKALRSDKTRKEIVGSAVVLLDIEYNAVISTTEEDLCLSTPGQTDVVVLTKELCEPLYNYVTEVFGRMAKTADKLHYNRVVVSTYEGCRFEVMPSAVGEQDVYCMYRY